MMNEFNENNNLNEQENISNETIKDPIIEDLKQVITDEIRLQPNSPKQKTNWKTVLLSGTLATVLGFGGASLALQLNGENQTIVYQSPSTITQTTNDPTTLSVEAQVANAVSDSVVVITTETNVQSSFYQDYTAQAAGSGVIYSTNGYIITNNHVIEGATTIQVTLSNGETYPATLVGRDSRTDLAVIKIEKDGLTPATLGSSSNLVVGELAIAVGNPLGTLGGTVTNGIISATDREITLEDGITRNLLQTNAEINEGNSGGGLFNSTGELIGIVVAKSSGTNVEGIGFAIPVDDVKTVVEDIINEGYVTGRPALGVSVMSIEDYQTALSYGVDKYGVYIADIIENSAAQLAGLEVGDMIVGMNGQVVTSFDELSEIINENEVGDSVTIQIERNGQLLDIEATLQENTTQN